MERGALAGRAGSPDAAAVLGNDAAADGEAEAGASHDAGVRGVDLLETLEDVFELVRGGMPRPSSADIELGFVLVEHAGR